jgi:pyruvate dehydrogenase E2 component (dihydrolipoamide acetyltransferase)
MINTVIMPKQGLQMTEGVITKWFYTVGDTVKANKPLFQMETDKLTIDIDSQFDGILLGIIHDEGETVLITEPIAYIGSEGDYNLNIDLPELKAVSDKHVFASPRAKKTAAERGIDYKTLKGSGYNGIIIERDVLSAKHAEEKKAAPPEVKRPVTSYITAQAYHKVKTDMSGISKLCDILKAGGVNAGIFNVTAFAAVKALSLYPHLNADRADITLGVILPRDDGNKETDIENAEHMSLNELSDSMNNAETQTGSVFAVADYGIFGTDESFAALRRPLCALLTAGAVSDTPAVSDGTVVIRPMMTLMLTYDINIINDVYASKYLRHVKLLLENPNLLLI